MIKIQVTFDTKEDLNDLKRLRGFLDSLIRKKEKGATVSYDSSGWDSFNTNPDSASVHDREDSSVGSSSASTASNSDNHSVGGSVQPGMFGMFESEDSSSQESQKPSSPSTSSSYLDRDDELNDQEEEHERHRIQIIDY